MAYREHYYYYIVFYIILLLLTIWRPERCLDNLVIVCLCYLFYHQILMRGRRLGPK